MLAAIMLLAASTAAQAQELKCQQLDQLWPQLRAQGLVKATAWYVDERGVRFRVAYDIDEQEIAIVRLERLRACVERRLTYLGPSP
jgi:hypothetical protein